MGTKKQNIIILAVSLVISLGILVAGKRKTDPQHPESRIYSVNGGWGYDILVNKKLFIHQESVPVIQSIQPFKTKEDAERVAKLVIEKIETGHLPTLSKFDLEQILPGYVADNGQQRKDQ